MATRRPRQHWTPTSVQVDGEPVIDLPTRSSITAGIGARGIGERQIEARRHEMLRGLKSARAQGYVPSVDDEMIARRPAGDPAGMDAFFGLMQAKENAAKGAGMKFKFDQRDIGNEKVLDVPTGRTYSVAEGEIAPGMRERPPQEYANEMGFDPKKRGFYMPDEMSEARGGLERAFHQLRLRRR